MKNGVLSFLFFFVIALPLSGYGQSDPYPSVQEPHKSMLNAIDKIANGVEHVRRGEIGLPFPYGAMAVALHDAAGDFFMTLSLEMGIPTESPAITNLMAQMVIFELKLKSLADAHTKNPQGKDTRVLDVQFDLAKDGFKAAIQNHQHSLATAETQVITLPQPVVKPVIETEADRTMREAIEIERVGIEVINKRAQAQLMSRWLAGEIYLEITERSGYLTASQIRDLMVERTAGFRAASDISAEIRDAEVQVVEALRSIEGIRGRALSVETIRPYVEGFLLEAGKQARRAR